MEATSDIEPDPRRKLPPSLLTQRLRTVAGLLAPVLGFGLVVVLLTGSSGGIPSPGPSSGAPTVRPDKTPGPAPPAGPFTISYAAAANRLADLPGEEKQEQLRDWLRTALAAHLNLDIGHFRDAVHDTVPVRDDGLADITAQPTGPGRALFDGRDHLHLLVPSDDRHTSRTIGLLLDQHRADHGSDPQWVRTHRYTIDPRTQSIQVAAGAAQSTEQVRAAHGHVTMRVDQPGGLREFLDKTRHFSRLERRGPELWAAGWKWPTGSAPPMTMADVTAIQRGYQDDSGGPPGFSLDPPKRTGALPATRQGEMYHQARYLGGLEGTEVGMSLLYVDLITKFWINGTGSGVPTKAVRGFVPDPDARTPAAHCPADGEALNERGRLWFGQNASGFRFEADRVEVGARATRLFTRTSAGDGDEIESSYAFGRGIRWWDRHFQEVADYEPQYARLEQIMRWSGALEWLAAQEGGPALPVLADDEVRDDLTFRAWYKRHSELRERGEIRFVRPPSGRAETMVSRPSKAFEYCGRRVVKGGVSLADTFHRMSGEPWRPGAVPEGAGRAGLFAPDSRVDPKTGTGRFSQVWLDRNGKIVDRLDRRLSNGKNGSSIVETVGEQGRSGSFGRLKVWRAEDTSRSLRIERTAGSGVISERIALEGREWGRLEAVASKGRVLLHWIRGPVERTRLALQSAQDDSGSVPARDSVLYRYGNTYKVGGAGDPWLSISKDMAAPDTGLAFRLGAPRPGGAPEFSLGTLHAPRPGQPGSPRGPPGGWLRFPAERARGPVVVVAGLPPDKARTMRVETTDGRQGKIRTDGKQAWVRAGDPVMGLESGAPEAASLRDFDRVAEAANEAAQARDGQSRGVALGADGTALVGADKMIVAPPGHPFADRVREALGRDPARSRPMMGIESGHAVHHGNAQFVRSGQPEHMRLGDLDPRGNVLLSDRMRPMVIRDGMLLGDWLEHSRKVVVVKAEARIDPATESTRVLADSYREQQGTRQLTWLRVTGPGGRPAGSVVWSGPRPVPGPTQPSPSPSFTPPPPPLSGPIGNAVSVQVWLVCLDEGAPDPACVP